MTTQNCSVNTEELVKASRNGLAGVCPIHFKAFNTVNRQTQSLDATLLYARIRFCEQHTKITKRGHRWVVRSLTDVADWFGYSAKKAGYLLKQLEEQGLIQKMSSTWYGKKKLFLRTTGTAAVPVNLKLLARLEAHIGSLEAALLFAKLAFHQRYHGVQHRNKTWCIVKTNQLAYWLGVPLRRLYGLIKTLEAQQLLIKTQATYDGRRQSFYHISDEVIATCQARFAAELAAETEAANDAEDNSEIAPHTALLTAHQAQTTPESVDNLSTDAPGGVVDMPSFNLSKRGLSIRLSSFCSGSNITLCEFNDHNIRWDNSEISFKHIGTTLTSRQYAYLGAAYQRTLEKYRLNISNVVEVWQQILFYVLNPAQHRDVVYFTHVVNRAMAILRAGNWRIPRGFQRYATQHAISTHCHSDTTMADWAAQKQAEMTAVPALVAELLVGQQHHRTRQLTEQALRVANDIVDLQQRLVMESQQSTESLVQRVHTLLNYLETLFLNGASREAVKGVLQKVRA